jgi:hypothetical protein
MAGGCSTVSNNWVAVALGDRTTANGHTSFATGYKSVAMGHLTSAFGDTTTAIGDGAISMGHFTTAQAYGSLVIGRYNLIAGGTSAWNFWDPVFVIGNGTSKTARSNSFTVYNSGIADLQYFINLCSNPVNNTAIQVKGSEALWYDGTYFSWGYGGTYNVFARKTSIGTTANPGTYSLWVAGTAGCTGGLWSGSDIRWKKDLTRLENVIPGILSLSAYKFNWRKDEFPEMNFDRGNQVGLIAQDVEKIFPELVRTDEKGYKAVSYDKLSAILLQGMKEQQAQIDQQKRDNDDLRAELKTLNEEVKQLKAASGNK